MRRSFGEDNNDFALAMYAPLRRRPGNLFFSPFSIRTALGMTYVGARGETAGQMRDALGFASSGEILDVGFAEMIQRLNAAGAGKYETAVANSLWSQEGAPLQPEFLERVAQYYGGGMNIVDFRRAAEAARVSINKWVENKTKRKIRDLIPSGGLDEETRLVLVNAVYFKGVWVLQFRSEDSREEPFYLEGGGTVRAPLMHQHQKVHYTQAEGYQAVELDYEGDDLSMLVLLPHEKDGLRDLEGRLSARMLQDCVAKMDAREIKLFLPRFKITWGTFDMSRPLGILGMSQAFEGSLADFSGINGHRPPDDDALFISAVFHRAFVEVNEEGTEAAAATALSMTRSFARAMTQPIPIFRADHPFLFAIRDRKTETILFLGRMADPTHEN